MGFTLVNQNNYSNVKYANSANPTATIKSSGCGICSMAMILANLGGINITIADLAAYSLKNGCRASSGTNMVKLAKCICRDYPELTYTTTNDESVLKAHITGGGMAIMNADGDDGCDGIFAHGGHYLAILGIKNGKPVIGDPAYTPNRYRTTYRKKYVTELGDNLITCEWSTLDLDTKYRSPNYYLFTKKAVAVTTTESNEEEEMVYKDINEVPEWGKAAVQRRVDAKLTDGTNLTESMVRVWVIADREDPIYNNLEDVPVYWLEETKEMVAAGVIVGDGEHQVAKKRSILEGAVIAWRAHKLK